MTKLKVIFIFLIFTLFLSSCNGRKKYSYDPFLDLSVNINGSNGKAKIEVDISKVAESNIKKVFDLNTSDKNKKHIIDEINKIHTFGSYEFSKEMNLTNDDEVIIEFVLNESISLVKMKSYTDIYKVSGLNNEYTEKADLTSTDYNKIKEESKVLINQFLTEQSSDKREYTEPIFRSQYIIEQGKNKSVMTIFNAVSESILTNENKTLYEYIYPYIITDISFDQYGNGVLKHNDNDIKFISRYHQEEDLKILFEDIKFIDDIEETDLRKIEITTISNDLLMTLKSITEDEVNTLIKDEVLKDTDDEIVIYFKEAGLSEEKQTIAIMYEYKYDSDSKRIYFYKEFLYFIFDDEIIKDFKSHKVRLGTAKREISSNELIKKFSQDDTFVLIPY